MGQVLCDLAWRALGLGGRKPGICAGCWGVLSWTWGQGGTPYPRHACCSALPRCQSCRPGCSGLFCLGPWASMPGTPASRLLQGVSCAFSFLAWLSALVSAWLASEAGRDDRCTQARAGVVGVPQLRPGGIWITVCLYVGGGLVFSALMESGYCRAAPGCGCWVSVGSCLVERGGRKQMSGSRAVGSPLLLSVLSGAA